MREQTNLNVYLCYSFCKNRYLTHFFSHSAQGIRRGRTRQQKNLIRANYSCPSPDTHIHTHKPKPTHPHTQTKFIAPIIVGNMCAVVPWISPPPPPLRVTNQLTTWLPGYLFSVYWYCYCVCVCVCGQHVAQTTWSRTLANCSLPHYTVQKVI